MTINPLPPQAYTKETMLKAFQWMQQQEDGIKQMATTPDLLVSLYLKAKHQGEGALERPSIRNFKNELKNLAGMMGEFEVVENEATPPVPPAVSQAAASAAQAAQLAQTLAGGPPMSARSAAAAMAHAQTSSHAGAAGASFTQHQSPFAHHSAPHSHGQAPGHAPHPAPPFSGPGPMPSSAQRPMPELDTRSWLMIHEVKSQLNLSSDQEALRMLIAVGHAKMKALMADR